MDARENQMTKRAIELKTLPDNQKIDYFKKYEMINIKTYKCRNKQNISPVVNQDFDPQMVKINPSEIYEPRLKAYNAV